MKSTQPKFICTFLIKKTLSENAYILEFENIILE